MNQDDYGCGLPNGRRSASFWLMAGSALLLLFLHLLRAGLNGCSKATDAFQEAFWLFLRFGPILFGVLVFPAGLFAWWAGRRWHWDRWLGVLVSCLPLLGMAVSVAVRLPTPAALFSARTGFPWPAELTPGYRRSAAIYNVWLFHGEPEQIEAYLEANGFAPANALRVDPANPGRLLDEGGDPVYSADLIAKRDPPWSAWGAGTAYPVGGGNEVTDPCGWGVLVVDEERRRIGVEWGR